jgi:hypothetical protein
MRVGDGGAGARLAELEVVGEAQEGLDEEEGDDDGAEDGVGCVVELDVVSLIEVVKEVG